MKETAPAALVRFLENPRQIPRPGDLLPLWRDQTATLRLLGAAPLAGPILGAHLRRSFLGALGPGASPDARRGEPCPWDPPCALDVFRREQMRGARGDGLPKPYVIFTAAEGDDLMVSLRVFGRANIWFAAAAEAFGAGLRDILPWQKAFGRAAPRLAERKITQGTGLALPEAGGRAIVLEFLSPVDVSGVRGAPGPSLLSRIIRRAGGLARWHGLALDPERTRALTAGLGRLEVDESGLARGRHQSPNRHRQKRTHETCSGRLRIAGDLGDLGDLLPMLAIGARCHVGRGAVEGLGRFRLRFEDPA